MIPRLLHILRVLLKHGTAHFVVALTARWPKSLQWITVDDLDGPVRLRLMFEDLGGSFIKFGQMLALQPDILPIRFCDALFNLLDRVEPIPFPEVERVIIEDLGRPPAEIFDSIDTEPLATASIGQVHVAYLDGEKVAVKIQRPNAQRDFQNDIRLMAAAIRLIRVFHLQPFYWLLEPMSEFVSWTNEELDYRYEATYSERLRSLAADNPVQCVPRVYRRYATQRVLIVEFLDGETLLGFLRARDHGDEVLIRRLQAAGFDRAQFARNVIDNFLGDAFRHGIYHADLHPANLMILQDNVVGYFDFGITGVMSSYARSHLMKMTLALTRGDTKRVFEEYLKVTVHGSDSDFEGFKSGLRKVAAEWYTEDEDGCRLTANFTRIMSEMLELSRRNNIMPERDVIKYIRSSIAIDGLVTRFVPEFELGRYIADTCSLFLKSFQRSSSFSTDSLIDWSTASARLSSNGVARGARLLDRMVSGELPIQAETGDRSQSGEAELRRRALWLGGAVLGGSLLAAYGPPPSVLGPNLWTAALLFVGAALSLLLRDLTRLAR